MKTNGRLHLYPFLRVAVFFIIGIATGTHLYNKVSAMLWLYASFAIIAAYLLLRRHSLVQSCLVFLLVLTLGAALASNSRAEAEMRFPDREVDYHAVVTSRPVTKGKTVRCDLMVTDFAGKPFKIKAMFLKDADAVRLGPGCGVEVFSRISRPENYPNSTFDYRRYLLFHGYKGTTFIPSGSWRSQVVSLKPLGNIERLKLRALVFRERLLERYTSLGISGQDYAVLSAMTLGDKTGISSELTDDYSISGAAHVLALSGLHMGIIFTVLTFILSKLRMRAVSLVLVVMAIWAYVFIVGMSPSVMRAAVMLTIYSFVSLLNRDNMSLNTLALTAVVLLAVSPLDLYDVGFQMSFMAVLFILLLYRPLYYLMPYRWRHIRLVDWLWQMSCVSFTAQLGVAPLVVLYFGRFSCYFLPTNFLVIPLATFILYGAVLLVIATPLPLLQGCVATVLFKLTSWLNDGVSFIASLPGASIDGLHLSVFQTFCCYAAIAFACLVMRTVRRMFWFTHRPLDYMNMPNDKGY